MLRKAKRMVESVASRLGYTIIPNWRLEHYDQERYLAKLFQLLEIDCVLDVGANRGQYRDFLRDYVGYSGTIVSFEPIPALVEELRARASTDPAWIIEGCALGSERKTAPFNVMSSSVFSSFLSPDHSKVSRFDRLNTVREQIVVDAFTLDERMACLSGRLGPRRTYLKLDTQGSDLDVAKGAAKTLKQVLALQTEVSFKPIYAGMPDFVAAIRSFEALGFEVSGLFKLTDVTFPELIELDCHMISTEHVGGQGRGRPTAPAE